MGTYDVAAFNQATQRLIEEQGIDINGDEKINVDNGELAKLLSATGANNVNDILEPAYSLKYESNNDSNIFFKEYLEQKAEKQGIIFPIGMKINVSSPKELSPEFIELLSDVRVNIYGARAHDMFNLLVQDKEYVNKRVDSMRISDEEKNKILTLKEQFDNYYKIEAMYQGKTYDLLSTSNEDLNEISPEFANFIKKEVQELRENATNMTRNVMSAEAHKDAGKESVNFIPTLCTILGASAAVGMAQSGYDAYRIKYAPIVDDLSDTFKATKKGLNPLKWGKACKNFVSGLYKGSKNKNFYSTGMRAYITEQRTLAQTGRLGLVNPVKSVVEKVKNAPGKIGKILALASIITLTALGSTDDCGGCVKDYKQDKNNFGDGFAKPTAYCSGGWGIVSSFAIAATLQNATDVMKARNFVNRNILGKNPGFWKKLASKFTVANLKTAGKLGLLGIVVAMCSSGSSHMSMALTRWKFGKNGDELQEKNIITAEENTFKAANKNMMDYAAYYGKMQGILSGPFSDPIIGFVTGSTGLLFHPNSYISGATFAAQGSSETWIASIYQTIDNKIRQRKIEKAKQKLINDAA